MRLWFERAIRPPVETIPAENPGDPHGVAFEDSPPAPPPPRPVAQAWDGWPDGWQMPYGGASSLTDVAWTCVDLNASILATMPPYLVDSADNLDAAWLDNPNPDLYTSWAEFAKALFWDYQLGEAFVLATARYSTGYPARFHVVPPWAVQIDNGRYKVGSVDVTGEILHVRYQGSVGDSRGHGPLEAGWARVAAARMLTQYGAGLASTGGVPSSILFVDSDVDRGQAEQLKADWVAARLSSIGEPAVMSANIRWEATQLDPEKMALVDLQKYADARIAVMLGVPPFLVGLPSGGDPMTYSNVNAIFDYHWRAGLRPKAGAVTAALSGWLLPRGTTIELNRDSYVQPDPLARAQAAQIYANIRDNQGNAVLGVDEIRRAERFDEGAVGGDTPRQTLAQFPLAEVPE